MEPMKQDDKKNPVREGGAGRVSRSVKRTRELLDAGDWSGAWQAWPGACHSHRHDDELAFTVTLWHRKAVGVGSSSDATRAFRRALDAWQSANAKDED